MGRIGAGGHLEAAGRAHAPEQAARLRDGRACSRAPWALGPAAPQPRFRAAHCGLPVSPISERGALAVEMDLWVARGLHLETEAEASARAIGARGHDGAKSGGPAEADRADLSLAPPSPRTQALLDSEILQAMLMNTVERCLGLHGSSHEEGWHASHFLSDPEEPRRRRRVLADGREDAPLQVDFSDEESSAADTDRRSFESQPESSPTSTIWSEWDSLEHHRRTARKRRREDGEQSWDVP